MAGIVAVIPLCPNVYAMYVLMVIKGMCFVIKESTVSWYYSCMLLDGNSLLRCACSCSIAKSSVIVHVCSR
jgi:hypothetical protein